MSRFLIIYDSVYGHTQKIAERIAGDLRRRKNFVDVVHVTSYPHEVSPDIYDGVIIGGSVHAGKISSVLFKWVKSWRSELVSMPTAFFCVCLGILEKDPKVQAEIDGIVKGFFANTNWQPRRWDIFAGALAYSKYNFVIRWFMRRIAKKAGGDTDVSHDYEYTDWNQVSNFTEEFCQTVTGDSKEMSNWQI